MDLGSNTVLITGGASGIGLALAERFLDAGSEVVICGRREDALRQAQSKRPKLRALVSDLARESERCALIERVTREFPRFNVLINNAGIQRRIRLADAEEWEQTRQEIAINLEAPVHLCRLAIPHLARQARPAIVNVTSGLAFVPGSFAPVYCATKAALRSFTMTLRHQLAATPIQVVELIPPAVNTGLGGPGLHAFGAPLDAFADAALAGLARGDLEIAYDTSEKARLATREELAAVFSRLNPA